ncbi:MAG: methyltransferase domain-containing protein [Acidimicrobiia bacterium]|nr:methyltransferase domain-containing protein [Acidimicrobiia bacterium]
MAAPAHQESPFGASPGELAARLVRVFHPASVLEVGCGDGSLVEALRTMGVDAAGTDVDERAWRDASADVREHLHVARPDEPHEGKYELVLAVDALEDLAPDEVESAVRHLTSMTGRLVVGTAPGGVGTVAVEDLAALLATCGFLRSPTSGVGLLPDHLAVYEAHPAPTLVDVVQSSERTIFRQQRELHELRSRVDELETDLASVAAAPPARPEELRALEDQLDAALAERDHAHKVVAEQAAELTELNERYGEQVARLSADAEASRSELHERRLEVLRLRDRVIGREEELGTALGRLAEAESELSSYTGLPERYHEVVHSTTWRLMWRIMTPYRKIRERTGAAG